MGCVSRSACFLSLFRLAVLLLVSLTLANGAIIPDLRNSNNYNYSANSHDDDTLQLLRNLKISHSRLTDSIDFGSQSEFLEDIITPSYLKHFFANFNNEQNRQFIFGKLFEGVQSADCKAHIIEWLLRIQKPLTWSNLKDEDQWGLHMLDSWAKPPEGFLNGHINAFGDFDECVNIDVKGLTNKNPFPVPGATSKDFEGRYCTVYVADYATSMSLTVNKPKGLFPFHTENETRDGLNRDLSVRKAVTLGEFAHQLGIREGVVITPSAGVCFPNSCIRNDINQVLVNAMEIIYTNNSYNRPPPESGYPQKNYLWPYALACYVEKKPDFDAADISVMALIGTLTALCLGAGVLDFWLNHGVEKPPNRGLAFKYLMAFSLYTNIRKWMSTRKSGEDLGCLHGIRFFSTSWVVLAHTYYAITFLPSWNMIDVKTVYNDWSVLTVINSTFAVDTFFVLSGMLVGYNILKVLDKTKGKLNIIMLYVHRYLRLTPTYAILIGIMATIIPYLGNGPYWAVMTRWGEICEDNWWTNMLYVNNFVNTSWLCQGEAWYLANDMQFYIISPFILYPMWRWEMVGLLLLAVYTVLSIACPALLVHYLDTTPTTLPTRDIGKWFTHIYIRPYARIQTFLVGIWLAWILHKTRGKKVKIPKLVVILLWTLSTALAPFLLYSIQPWFDPEKEIPKVAGLAYAGLSRVGWGLIVSWVIFACIKGYGGLVNSFLSWSPFMPLGRLCYCVYLVSLHLQMILHIRFTQPMKYDTYTQINFFFAHMLMSFIVGFFCTLLFETPFMILQKLIFEGAGGGGPRPAKNVKRPSKRYGIFYNDVPTLTNGQANNGGVTAPSEKERQD